EGEAAVLDAVHLERHRDRPYHHGQVPSRASATLLSRGRLALCGVERGAGAAEVDLAAGELLHARTRTGGVVVDRRSAALLLVVVDPLRHGIGLGRRSF